MKKLIILLFLLISTPTLAGDQDMLVDEHTELNVNVSDIVASIGKPDYSYAVSVFDDFFDDFLRFLS